MAIDLPTLTLLPKSDLHVHLRGAMPIEYFATRLEKYHTDKVLSHAPERHITIFRGTAHLSQFISRGREASHHLDELFSFSSFEEFLATYLFTSYFIRDEEDFRGLIAAVLEKFAAQGIVYAEITVSAIEYISQGLTMPQIAAALDTTKTPQGLRVQWIIDLVRDIGAERALSLLHLLLENRPPSVVGITIGGNEVKFPPELFSAHYKLARSAGLRRSAHAGEACGPESVWNAIRALNVERIGHGIRSIEDSSLVEHLAIHRLPLEVSVTSNLRTGVVRALADHPVRKLYQAGVPITVNTDDPTFFSTTLCREYLRLAELGFSDSELLELMENGFRFAFLAEHEKRRYIDELRFAWARRTSPVRTDIIT